MIRAHHRYYHITIYHITICNMCIYTHTHTNIRTLHYNTCMYVSKAWSMRIKKKKGVPLRL